MTDAPPPLDSAVDTILMDVARLVVKARALTELIADAEARHGGLIGQKTLRAANELRLELSNWEKPK